jgi:5-methylcytosine-specific restriction endonuclease McrA
LKRPPVNRPRLQATVPPRCACTRWSKPSSSTGPATPRQPALRRPLRLAVTEKLERVEAKRFGKTREPRKTLAETDTTPTKRHIPAAVRRAVHARDGGRCAYRDKNGRRCAKRHDLELHHKKPFARGGDHSPSNVTLLCSMHNTLMAELDYGKDVIDRFRVSAGRSPLPVDVYGDKMTVQARSRAPG